MKNTTNKNELIYKDLTYKIRGCLFAVYNELGHGHKEQVYQKALAKELKDNDISFLREKSIKVTYKDEAVGNYRPDFIVDNKVIIETKAVEFLPKTYEQQLVNYLKSVDYKLGLLVNFGSPRLLVKRLVWTNTHPRKSAKYQRKSVLNQRKSNNK